MKADRPNLSTLQKILYQVFVAFGQGAGPLRVSRATCAAIHAHYAALAEIPSVRALLADPSDPWGQPQHGPYALEQVRATGRLAAELAVQAGSAEISAAQFQQAARTVESRTRQAPAAIRGWWCPPEDGG